MNRTAALFCLISCLPGHLAAETIQLNGHVEGFTFDRPSGSFRAVLGLPGSAIFGGANTESFEQGSVAPRKDYGVGFKAGQAAFVTGLGSAIPSVSPLSGVGEGAEGVVWSADGSLAVFFSRSGNWLQTLAGFPAPESPEPLIDLSSLSGALTAVAADSSGKQIAIGLTGESGGVYLMAGGGAPVLMLASSNPVTLTFSDDGKMLFSIDAATLQVTAFHLSNYSSESFPLEGLLDPIAIKWKRDAANRDVLLVAGRNDYLLRVYDANSHEILANLPLDSPPTRLSDFGRYSLLLTTRTGDSDPLWLFTGGPRQDVFFIPAPSPVSKGPQ